MIGIVHWGLNTYTDREWGYGDADPALLAPSAFDAAQIVGAAKAAGIGGLVVVAKHHDGFCLWPTKTTDYNIARSPFRGGKGDYVKEMETACRAAGLEFGIYVSPWDRHDADYAADAYVGKYREQTRELLDGSYGAVFEMWFDGANGGDGWYGGAKERRGIGSDYYRFGELAHMARTLQPRITIFGGGQDADFRWPGNERGILDPDSRATCRDTHGMDAAAARAMMNRGSPDGDRFQACEADFPLRKGWFWHESEAGTTKTPAQLLRLYLASVGNGGTMNIGLAPNRDGRLDDADVAALAGFGRLLRALFERETTRDGGPFNVVVLREDVSRGENVDGWELLADGEPVLCGRAVGAKRIRLLPAPCRADSLELKARAGSAAAQPSFRLYLADERLVREILSPADAPEETDTARWMARTESPRR